MYIYIYIYIYTVINHFTYVKELIDNFDRELNEAALGFRPNNSTILLIVVACLVCCNTQIHPCASLNRRNRLTHNNNNTHKTRRHVPFINLRPASVSFSDVLYLPYASFV